MGVEATNFRGFNADPIHVKLFGEQIRARIPGLRDATLVFIPESNFGRAAGHIDAILETTQTMKDGGILVPTRNYFVLNADRGFVGIRTNAENKRNAAFILKTYLETNSIAVHEKAFSNTPGGWNAVRKMTYEQLGNFKRILEISPNGKRVTEMFSGKDKGPDDIPIAFMLCLYGRGVFNSHIDEYDGANANRSSSSVRFIDKV